MVRFYAWTLEIVLQHRFITLMVFVATVVLTVAAYIHIPKGYFPQDDTGLMFGGTEASPDISFKAMSELQQKAAAIVMADPAVQGVASSVGTSNFNPSANQGRLFIGLKPLQERKLSSARVAERLRRELSQVVGIRVFLVPAQDLRVGARQSKAQYQFTLWTPDLAELEEWTPKVLARVRKIPGLVDVTTDREQGGLQANVVIDRAAAARLGVRIQDIDNALNNAFAQRQISTIYTQRNQYRVVMETDPALQRDPSHLDNVYVTASTLSPAGGGCAGSVATTTATTAATGVLSGAVNRQVPLSAVTRFEKTVAPLVINHQGQFPAITITYNLAPDAGIEESSAALQQAVADLHMPDTIHAEFAGDSKAFAQTVGAQPLLILAALLAVYIVLGVLYESLAHPLTIISTLPSAGLGALPGAQIVRHRADRDRLHRDHPADRHRQEERHHAGRFRARGRAPARAFARAGDLRGLPRALPADPDDPRWPPLLGAVPLAIAGGPGSELPPPAGITIIGGSSCRRCSPCTPPR